jgi:outer membrane protein assembly factor BamD
MARLTLYIWLLMLAATIYSCKFNRIRKSTDLKEKYDAAINYYEKKEYYKAGLLFEEIIPLITGTKESERAQFYYGYCHYHQRQLDLAAYYFQKFYETFRNSKYVEEARYMQVRSLYDASPPYNLDQSNTISAINTTQSFLNAFPNSSYFEECGKLMKELRRKLERKAFENAKLYYRIGSYKAAVMAFTNFQKTYPDSDFNEDVSFYKIDAQYRYTQQSIESKKQERYRELINYYEYFSESFPNSRYARNAKSIYEKSAGNLNKKN